MRKTHRRLGRFLWGVVVLGAFYFDFSLSDVFLSNLLTVISIVFGFYFTGLSVLIGSAYSKALYQTLDAEVKNQTQMDTFVIYFRYAAVFSLASVVLILLLMLLIGANDSIEGRLVVTIGFRLIASFSLGFSAVGMLFFYLLFNVFLSALRFEVMSKSNKYK